jgi:hypothetical protein
MAKWSVIPHEDNASLSPILSDRTEKSEKLFTWRQCQKTLYRPNAVTQVWIKQNM